MTHEKIALPELPEATKRKTRKGKTAGLFLLFFLLAGAGIYSIRYFSAVHTPSALLEGDMLTLGPQLSGRVAEVLVQKTQKVAAGQILMRFEPDVQRSKFADAEAQVAGIRKLLPAASGMRSVAEHAADAESAERDIVNRITQAQDAEDAAVRDLQQKSEEHAKAQLELRRLDLLSAQYTIPSAQYDKARHSETATRRALEKARAAREENSRIRASVEMELRRTRMELAELRAADIRARDGNGDARITEAEPYALVAPVESVVADVFTREGARISPNQPLITLLPEGNSFNVTAWISPKESRFLQPGGSCRVFILELPGQSFAGRVEQLLPAGSVLPKYPLSGLMPEHHVPVRIRLTEKNPQISAALKPGMRAGVRMYRFDSPWDMMKTHLRL